MLVRDAGALESARPPLLVAIQSAFGKNRFEIPQMRDVKYVRHGDLCWPQKTIEFGVSSVHGNLLAVSGFVNNLPLRLLDHEAAETRLVSSPRDCDRIPVCRLSMGGWA